MQGTRWERVRSFALALGCLAAGAICGALFQKHITAGRVLQWAGVTRPQSTLAEAHALQAEERLSIFASLPRRVGGVLFLGDSHIEHGEWAEWFGRADIQNRGVGRIRIGGLSRCLPEVYRQQPSQIVIMCGVNDLLADGISTDRVARGYRELLSELRTALPQTKVLIHSILPVAEPGVPTADDVNAKVMEINGRLANEASEAGVSYVDLYSRVIDERGRLRSDLTYDGIHLNGKGYALWCELLRPHLARPE